MASDQEGEKGLGEEAEELIRQVMAKRKPAGENSLEDIEGLATGAGRGFEESVLAYLVGAEGQAEEEPQCEKCGCRMRSRGKRERHLITQAGEVKVERRYYVWPHCGQRIFPPG